VQHGGHVRLLLQPAPFCGHDRRHPGAVMRTSLVVAGALLAALLAAAAVAARAQAVLEGSPKLGGTGAGDAGILAVHFVQRVGAGALLATLLPASAVSARAQSLLERSPNLGGTWAGDAGILHFHFMHRFEATDPPARKVLNSPTFLLAAALPRELLVGARYAT